jgi:type IV pilus assembly protein PilB
MSPEAPGFYGDKIDLSTVDFTPELLRSIPARVALRHGVLPVFQTESGDLGVALADPSDIDTIDSLTHQLHREIRICLADHAQLGVFLQRLYGAGGSELWK